MAATIPVPDSATACSFAAWMIAVTGTPLGQEASHARHPVQVARRSLKIPDTASLPSRTALTRAILPRADRDSPRSWRKLGQTARQAPHFTQREISLRYRSREVII